MTELYTGILTLCECKHSPEALSPHEDALTRGPGALEGFNSSFYWSYFDLRFARSRDSNASCIFWVSERQTSQCSCLEGYGIDDANIIIFSKTRFLSSFFILFFSTVDIFFLSRRGFFHFFFISSSTPLVFSSLFQRRGSFRLFFFFILLQCHWCFLFFPKTRFPPFFFFFSTIDVFLKRMDSLEPQHTHHGPDGRLFDATGANGA